MILQVVVQIGKGRAGHGVQCFLPSKINRLLELSKIVDSRGIKLVDSHSRFITKPTSKPPVSLRQSHKYRRSHMLTKYSSKDLQP
jgi:hypothetical protein